MSFEEQWKKLNARPERRQQRRATRTADEVLEQAWIAEPELSFWLFPNGLGFPSPNLDRWPEDWVDWSRLAVVGRNGRIYSRAVTSRDSNIAIRRLARELREQIEKTGGRK